MISRPLLPLLVYIVGERNSGTNLLETCLTTMLHHRHHPPHSPSRLPFREDDAKGWHSKHLYLNFRPHEVSCPDRGLFVHIRREPCSWADAMWRRPRAGHAVGNSTTLAQFVRLPWQEHVPGAVSAVNRSLLGLYAKKLALFDELARRCKHVHRLEFAEFLTDPAAATATLARAFGLNTTGRACHKALPLLPCHIEDSAREAIERVMPCSRRCWKVDMRGNCLETGKLYSGCTAPQSRGRGL